MTPYRATVEAIDDPERRFRVRVRVIGVHREDIPIEALPWAEVAVPFSSKQAGDIPHYERGDTVWVLLEANEHDKPVIFGGWITNSGGIPDIPVDQTDSYKTSRRRWKRTDRNGNELELSEIGGENHAKLRSGNAEVVVTQNGNAVRVKSASGPIEMVAKLLSVTVDEVNMTADNIEISADDSVLGVPTGQAAWKANDAAILYGGISTYVGVYTPAILGVPVALPKQSIAVQVGPSVSLKLGAKTGDLVRGAPLQTTISAELDAATVRVGGTVQAKLGSRAADAPLVPTAIVEIAGLVINVYGDTAVNVHAPAVSVQATTVAVTAAGAVSVTAGSSIALNAPNLTMTGVLTFLGDLTVEGNIFALGEVAANTALIPVHLGLHTHPFVGVPVGNLSATTPSVGP